MWLETGAFCSHFQCLYYNDLNYWLSKFGNWLLGAWPERSSVCLIFYRMLGLGFGF